MATRMTDRTVFTISDIHALLPKFDNTDPDIRFMTLDDLHKVLTSSLPNLLSTEAQLATRLITNVVDLLDDTNGGVRSHALRCITPLASKIPSPQQFTLVDRVLQVSPVNSSDTSMVPNALRAIVAGFSQIKHTARPELNATNAYEILETRLIPRLLDTGAPVVPQRNGRPQQLAPAVPVKSGMLVVQSGQDVDPDFLDLATAFIEAYGSSMNKTVLEKFQVALLQIIKGHSKISNTNRKKAVSCCALLTTFYGDNTLGQLLKHVAEQLNTDKLGPVVIRFMVSLIGAVVQQGSRRISSHDSGIIEPILGLLSEQTLQNNTERYAEDDAALCVQYDEVTEASFESLEEIFRLCPPKAQKEENRNEVKELEIASINACLRFTRYNPSLLEDDDEDMENGENAVDGDDDVDMNDDYDNEFDDFEEEADENEDGTWRVRRNAVKALYTIFKAIPRDNKEVETIAVNVAIRALVKALREKEESVLLETIRTLDLLIQHYTKDAGYASSDGLSFAPAIAEKTSNWRKRPRSRSDGNDERTTANQTSQGLSPTPTDNEASRLGGSLPSIITGMNQILASKNQVPCKKQALLLLLDVVRTRSLHDKLPTVLDRVIANFADEDSIPTSTAYSTISSIVSAKFELLQLLGAIVSVQPMASVLPKLDKIVDVVLASFKDRDGQIQGHAIRTSEKIIQAIVRRNGGDAKTRGYQHISTIAQELSTLLQQPGIESEVKHIAIAVLGLCFIEGAIKTQTIASSFAQSVRSQLLAALDVESSYAAAAQAFSLICSEANTEKDLSNADLRHVFSTVSERLSRQDIKVRQSGVNCLQSITISKFCMGLIDQELLAKAAGGLVGMIRLNVNDPKDAVLDILSRIVRQWPQVLKVPAVGEGIFSFVDMPLDRRTSKSYVRILENVRDTEMLEFCATKFWHPAAGHSNLPLFGICMATVVASLPANSDQNVRSLMDNLKAVKESTFEDGVTDLYALGELARRGVTSDDLVPDTFIRWIGPKSPAKPFVESSRYIRMREAAAISIGRAAAGDNDDYFETLMEVTKEIKARDKSNSFEEFRTQIIDDVILDGVREFLFSLRSDDERSSTFFKRIWAALEKIPAQSENRSNVVSDCLGKILELSPKTYIPKLPEKLDKGDHTERSRCIQGLRCAFRDADYSIDQEISGHLQIALNIMLRDSDLVIADQPFRAILKLKENHPEPNRELEEKLAEVTEPRRQALENIRHGLMTLNTINNASHVLISPYLSDILPVVMQRATIDERFIRGVKMGPFVLTVDDGLAFRRVAYETIYSMLKTGAVRYFDKKEVFKRILEGLSDDNEIQITSNLLIARMIEIDPEETKGKLDALAEKFTLIYRTKLKENAVKQDFEKLQAVHNEVLKTSVQLQQEFMGGPYSNATDEGHAGWKAYWIEYGLKRIYGQKLHQNGN